MRHRIGRVPIVVDCSETMNRIAHFYELSTGQSPLTWKSGPNWKEPDRAGPARRSVIQARQGCPELARIRVPTGTCHASSGLESLF
jgi:hypothetical protein